MYIPSLICPNCSDSLLAPVPLKDQHKIQCESCEHKIIFRDGFWNAHVFEQDSDFGGLWDVIELKLLGDSEKAYGRNPTVWLDNILKRLEISKNELRELKILDVGFGQGLLLREIQKYSKNVIGIDLIAPPRLEQLTSASIFCGDLHKMPFKNQQFDLVICSGVIQHLDQPELALSCVAEKVGLDGTLYLETYEHHQKKSLLLRKIFPYSWKYPTFVLIFLSFLLGAIKILWVILTGKKSMYPSWSSLYNDAKLTVYDNLCPRIVKTFDPSEIFKWLKKTGLHGSRAGKGIFIANKD